MPFCANCGHQVSEYASACPECGHPTGRMSAGPAGAASVAAIPTYLVQSILVTLFCCLPFGIVSIVYATQVSSKLASGDIAGAQLASSNAKRWAWISFAAGLFAIAFFFVTRSGTKF